MREVRIPIQSAELDGTAGFFHDPTPPRRGSAVLLAHGAGVDPTSDFLRAMAEGLAQRGFPVLAFRYAYRERIAREKKQRPPDPRELLEHVHERALEVLRELQPDARVLLGGKSLGGRIGTHLAAKGADARGLVLFGYPLHPPGRPEKSRSEHFPAIAQPALFLQGTRDEFCDLELLRKALRTYGGRATVSVIEGADHAFEVPASLGRARDEVWRELLERVDAWERATFPS